jgi:hypothetical protein
MTKANMEVIANEIGGFENIVAIRCANGSKFYFGRYALKADDFVTMGDMEMLKLYHKDTMGGEAISYLDVSEIVQVLTVTDITKPIILRDMLD